MEKLKIAQGMEKLKIAQGMEKLKIAQGIDATSLGKFLKKNLQDKFGFKLKVKTTGSKKPNPFIMVQSVNWREDKIPNDFRVSLAKSLDVKPLDWNNVIYGNITDSYITLHADKWQKLIDEGIV